MRYFITGVAGFIGSNLADRLLLSGSTVVGWDNFSTGQHPFLAAAVRNSHFKLIHGDILDLASLTQAMRGCDFVFHLAANADVRFGLEHPRKDLEQNTIGTFNVLEAMRANGIRRLGFSSTGSVYGEAEVIPTPESASFPIQTSLYAASKLAGESLIQAYCEGYGFESYIFRFVSILGERYSHGHVFDFFRQLMEHRDRLTILGNGTQRKSYLYVQDCIDAMLHVIGMGTVTGAPHGVQIYNLGTEEFCTVKESIGWICAFVGAQPKLHFTGGGRGWIGDNPFIFLDTKKIRSTGWRPRYSIQDGVKCTLSWLNDNCWVFDARGQSIVSSKP